MDLSEQLITCQQDLAASNLIATPIRRMQREKAEEIERVRVSAAGLAGGMRTHRQSRRGKKSRSKRRKSRSKRRNLRSKKKEFAANTWSGKAKRPTKRDLSTCRAIGEGAIELLIDCQREKRKARATRCRR